MTPNQFRAGGPNAEIKFAIGESSLGLVLIASSEKGVCAIFFGDDPDGLARDLKRNSRAPGWSATIPRSSSSPPE